MNLIPGQQFGAPEVYRSARVVYFIYSLVQSVRYSQGHWAAALWAAMEMQKRSMESIESGSFLQKADSFKDSTPEGNILLLIDLNVLI